MSTTMDLRILNSVFLFRKNLFFVQHMSVQINSENRCIVWVMQTCNISCPAKKLEIYYMCPSWHVCDMFPFVMQPKVWSECVGMISFLASSDTCRSSANRYTETMAFIATLGHPYNPDSRSMKQTFHALMMTDFMGEIPRMRMEYASCAGKWCP
jgi:hypothetical protein